MKKEKLLISVENLNEIKNYEKIGISNFLFAVKDFSIGYPCFTLDEIKNVKTKGEKFLYINRIFDTEAVDNFKKLKNELVNFKYIIFEDIAVYNILKDTDIFLIWNTLHYGTNYKSINNWLEYTDSAIISNELDLESIKEILNKCSKPLILNVFGKNNIMYSRRFLISNFNKKFNLKQRYSIIAKERVTNNEFLVKESIYGTVFFNNKFFNLIPNIDLFRDDKILYYLVFIDGINITEFENILNNNSNLDYDDGFLNKKTFYKIGE